MDRYARARRHFEAALVATQQPLTSAQREHVHQLLEQSRTRTGRFALSPSPANARIFIDEQQVASRLLLLDVGAHELYVNAEGHRPLHRSFEMHGGEDELLELPLQPEQPAPPLASRSPAERGAARAASAGPDAATGPHWGALVTSASGVLLVGAIVTEVSEQAKESDLDALCPGRVCQPADRRRASMLSSEIETLQVFTDVLLFTGLAGLGIGTWLWLSRDDRAEASSATLRPELGCDSTGCRLRLAGRL
jgi:hypothetical protein